VAQLETPEKPKRKKARREQPIGERCFNCGEETQRRFCPECGQENRPPELTLQAVLREFIAEIAYYDSKMWRTLRLLITRPGQLSIEWSQGKRASYISPVRLYLMVTFAFFLGTAWRASKPSVKIWTALSTAQKQDVIKGIAKEQLTPDSRRLLENGKSQMNLTPAEDKQFEAALDRGVLNQKNADMAAGMISDNGRKLGLGDEAWFLQRVSRLQETDPQVLASTFLSQVPKVFFVILPLFAMLLRALYWRIGRTFVEHLVFILHLHSFAFLLFLPGILISTPWMGAITMLFAFFCLPAYAYVAMLRFYRQPWWLTLIKSWFLDFGYLLLIIGGTLVASFLTVENLPQTPPAGSQATLPIVFSKNQ
jgi:hypothetical protein